MTNAFTTLLSQKSHLLTDGATGTNLFNMGLSRAMRPSFGMKPSRTKSVGCIKTASMRAVICF